MAESVTRHAQNPFDGNSKFLLCGIDSLDLGLYVTWDALWEKVTLPFFNSKKEMAQGTTGITEQTDLGRSFLILPGGKAPNYRFHLQFPEYHIFLGKSASPGKSPNVYVSINASTLWHVELETILELLEYDLSSYGGTIDRIQPSRVDLCADFRMDAGLSFPFLEQHRVSRSHKINSIHTGPVLETYYCGSPSCPIRLRIYDKSKEIAKNNKQWFRNLWEVDQDAIVWRVEFQLRRPVLKQFRIMTLDDLWQKIGSVWEYLAGEWFSLRLPDNDKAERRTIHPWWLSVQNCRGEFGDSIGIKRIYKNDEVEPIQNILAHIMGRMVSVAAYRGINDRKKAIVDLFQMIFEKSSDEKFASEYQKRVIRLSFRGSFGGDDHE
ncbi:plasmid replication initiation factor [Geobacter pelophilus]|uniref:Plasmid replication initiation factor n=2 Tax=Geoanaerobacter pelophilus TaxID=60036 RepID=A0AAW4L9T5_9BACT|nr:plasmid replication initiation factor [Geoanaerobacter pelophilus]